MSREAFEQMRNMIEGWAVDEITGLRAKVAELEAMKTQFEYACTGRANAIRRAESAEAKVSELEEKLGTTQSLLEASLREGVIGLAIDERDALAAQLDRVRELLEGAVKTLNDTPNQDLGDYWRTVQSLEVALAILNEDKPKEEDERE